MILRLKLLFIQFTAIQCTAVVPADELPTDGLKTALLVSLAAAQQQLFSLVLASKAGSFVFSWENSSEITLPKTLKIRITEDKDQFKLPLCSMTTLRLQTAHQAKKLHCYYLPVRYPNHNAQYFTASCSR